MRNRVSEIDELSDRDFETFQNSLHALLSGSFIIKGLDEHRRFYQFIIANLKLVEAYLNCSGLSLRYDESIGVISRNGTPSDRISLGIDETVSLLVLRLIYEEKRHDISLGVFPVICIRDFLEKFSILSKRQLKKTRFREILRRFQALKLISIKGDEADPETAIQLYPSIPFALDGQAIDDIFARISMLDTDSTDSADSEEIPEETAEEY